MEKTLTQRQLLQLALLCVVLWALPSAAGIHLWVYWYPDLELNWYQEIAWVTPLGLLAIHVPLARWTLPNQLPTGLSQADARRILLIVALLGLLEALFWILDWVSHVSRISLPLLLALAWWVSRRGDSRSPILVAWPPSTVFVLVAAWSLTGTQSSLVPLILCIPCIVGSRKACKRNALPHLLLPPITQLSSSAFVFLGLGSLRDTLIAWEYSAFRVLLFVIGLVLIAIGLTRMLRCPHLSIRATSTHDVAEAVLLIVGASAVFHSATMVFIFSVSSSIEVATLSLTMALLLMGLLRFRRSMARWLLPLNPHALTSTNSALIKVALLAFGVQTTLTGGYRMVFYAADPTSWAGSGLVMGVGCLAGLRWTLNARLRAASV